jgi:AP-1 complex subunit gamma-1
MAFLENVIIFDESFVKDIVNCVPKIGKAYKMIVQEHNTEYEIGGVQDPFLQVAILKLLRILKRYTNTFDKNLIEILVVSHDNVCSKISNNMKNGANAVLLECFQCFMILEPTNQLKDMVTNVLSKFISVKDANSKYLSLFNLNLMAKYDLSVVKNHKQTIFECLEENDNLIRNMALDLLYLIAEEDNAGSIVKELLNNLLSATDEEFIPELAFKICLIVEKHSQSRRWHFDTILKVLILADQSVKEESAKSLVHLVTSTPALQDYCMAKLFYSTCENIQNDALAKLCIYLMGEIGEILLKNK